MNMMITAPTATKMGHGAIALRAKGSEPLTVEQIAQHCPAVLADKAHDSRSERYTFISTYDLLRGLGQHGFHPWSVQQSGSKDEDKRAYTKHLIRFRSAGSQALKRVGDTLFEICLLNSHDGTTQQQVFAGFLRLACLNGMVVSDGNLQAIKIRHTGDVLAEVAAAMHLVIENGSKAVDRVQNFRAITLNRGEQLAFASAAATLRFEDSPPVQPQQLLMARRPGDDGNDLWRTFNRVQENVMRGGISYIDNQELADGRRRVINRHTKPVRSVDGDVKLNRALWVLAEELAKAKA